MSEMVERVARAIAMEYSGDPNYDWTAFEGEARVAIEAMTEPTPEMRTAAYKTAERFNPGRNADHVGSVALDGVSIYRSMIAAAVKSERKTNGQ